METRQACRTTERLHSMYNIIDRHTGKTVATAKTLAGANRAVDSRDNRYGAYRYRAERVYTLIPLESAFSSLQLRGITADYIADEVFCCRTGETIARIKGGMVELEIVDAYGRG